MATFEPVELTNGVSTVTALTAVEATQLIWDGWVPVNGQIVINPDFELFISRSGAVAGQVPVLQADGSLALQTVGGAGGGVTDHGDLTGLGDDDHTQYALTDGTRGDFAAPVHTHTSGQISDAASLATPGTLPIRDVNGYFDVATAVGANHPVRKSQFDTGITDAKARANHTGTQVAATISDLTETVQDIVAALIVGGTNVTVSYNDAAGTFTINSTGGTGGTTDPEIVRDTIGGALVAGSGIQITVNDAGDTITVASTAVLPTRQVIAGTGLSGGGDLSADRTLAVTYGTAAGTAAQGNDTRITAAVPNTRSIITGTGLTGGGTLAADRTLAVAYGSAAGTAVQGNDARVTADQAAATASIRTLGTGGQQAAPGNDARFGAAGRRQTISAKTAAYSVVLGDEEALVTVSTAATAAVTLPSDATSNMPIGGWVEIMQLGAGQTTIAAGAGATLAVPTGATAACRGLNCRVMAQKIAANTWALAGDLA